MFAFFWYSFHRFVCMYLFFLFIRTSYVSLISLCRILEHSLLTPLFSPFSFKFFPNLFFLKVQDSNADKYFLPFKLACETESSKLMDISLDCIQKMIAYNYLRGAELVDTKVYPYKSTDAKAKRRDSVDNAKSKARERRRLADVVIEVINDCSMYEHDKVQLQVIKAFLTAVTSNTMKVHAHNLLMGVRACYHIYLTSRSTANQTTAKGTLTHMMNRVFESMEDYAIRLKTLDEASAPPPVPEVVNPNAHEEKKSNGVSNGDEEKGDDTATTIAKSISTEILNRAMGTVANGDANGSNPTGTPQPATSNGTAASEEPTGSPPGKSPSGKYGLCVVCGGAAHSYCLQTHDPVCGMECKVVHFDDIINCEDATKYPLRTTVAATFSLLQNDCFLLFKALCGLSVKVLPNPPQNTSIAIASKTLALELLLSILDKSGSTFQNTEMFVDLVRENLVMSLLQNSVTTVEPVFRLSSSLFISLVAHFKPHLKQEIGVFLDNVYLKILASPNSTYAHKKVALKVIKKLCSDAQTIVELFLNYDCEMGNFNIFQTIVSHLEKIAHGTFLSKNWMSEDQEKSLRRLALESFGAIMNSLVVWTRKAGGDEDEEKGDDETDSVTAGSPLVSSRSTTKQSTNSLAPPGRDRRDSQDSGTSGGTIESGITAIDDEAQRPSFSEQFTLQQELKKKTEIGIVKFNLKPSRGVDYLREMGIIDDTPQSLATFLHRHESKFDKTVVGDYLGDHHDFPKSVLYAYVDQMDFHDMPFDEGIRMFVSGFRLPGEAQKIDRMMEKFADQFCSHNPTAFQSADTAYVLAYAVIMLNVDAHSDQVKAKMTKEEFLRNNRGIDNGQDVDPVYLGDLYDRIVHNEIKMKDTVYEARSKRVNPQTRYFNFMQESQKMIQQTEALIHTHRKQASLGGISNGDSSANSSVNGGDGDADHVSAVEAVKQQRLDNATPFYQPTAEDFQAVRPMFDIVWYPVLGTFSILMESTEDPRLIALCLDGYRYAIRIASAFDMDTPRMAFVKSLRQCTLLGTSRQMEQKNIDAVKMLLEIAYTEGNYLRDSWGEVLECISECERLHLLGTGARPRMDIFRSDKQMSSADLHHQAEREARDTHNSQSLIQQIEASLIDRIFTNSSSLNSEAIVDFVNHLRQVSEQELGFEKDSMRPKAGAGAPRVFSLQKIVEITYYNMGRIRITWSRIWQIMSGYFVKAGCHPTLSVSMFVIDSLRQLAMKFLEKDELSNYHFQKQFLKPFEIIMARAANVETMELIVQCIEQMILARVDNIKSGWKSVFIVIGHGGRHRHEPLVAATFRMVEQIMKDYFPLITDNIDECVNALVAFGENDFTDYSLEAIEHIGKCAQFLGEADDRLNGDSSHTAASGRPRANSSSMRPRSASSIGSQSKLAGISMGKHMSGDSENKFQGVRLERSISGESVASSADSSAIAHGENEDGVDIGAWFLVLTGLSRMISDRRLEVRSRALQVMFKILRTYGTTFGPSTWQMIFRGVLFPIFDDVINTSDGSKVSVDARGGDGLAGSWLQTTCFNALSMLVELYSYFQTKVGFLLQEILGMINNCIVQDNEELSRIGIRCWIRLLNVVGDSLSAEEWTLLMSSIVKVVQSLLPRDITSAAIRQRLRLGPRKPLSSEYIRLLEEFTSAELLTESKEDTVVSSVGSADESEGVTTVVPGPASGVVPEEDEREPDTPIGAKSPEQSEQAQSPQPPQPPQQPPPPPPPSSSSSSSNGKKPPPPPKGSKGSKNSKAVKSLVPPQLIESFMIRCMGQIMFMDSAYEVFVKNYRSFTEDHVNTLLDAFLVSVQFAHTFNADRELRHALKREGFVDPDSGRGPDLFLQESRGLQLYINVLFRSFNWQSNSAKAAAAEAKAQQENVTGDNDDGSSAVGVVPVVWQKEGIQWVEQRLFAVAECVLDDFLTNVSSDRTEDSYIKCMSSVIVAIIRGFSELSDQHLSTHLPRFYFKLMFLVQLGTPAIRASLTHLLTDRLPTFLPFEMSQPAFLVKKDDDSESKPPSSPSQ